MRGRWITRLSGLVLGVVVVLILAARSYSQNPHNTQTHLTPFLEFWGAWALGVGLVALIATPYVFVYPFRFIRDKIVLRLRDTIRRTNAGDVVAGVIGLLTGLIIAWLLTAPLSQLRFLALGQWLPTAVAIVAGLLGMAVAVWLRQDFVNLVATAFAARTARRAEREERDREAEDRDDHDGRDGRDGRDGLDVRPRDRARGRKERPAENKVLVDTSAIIDGRIADIGQTGFITGTLVVPRFVLEELQHIADSADSLRRNRGRRGLDILSRLQKETAVPVEISDADADGTHEVDAKLVKLARQWHCPIITNDFNLNQVAKLQGVKVLNINELAHAVKPILLPGEEMAVKIIQEGKELGQGVGYLDDGTMIVVEGGKAHVGSTLDVSVTRVLQTIAGRMIFAQPKPAQQSQGVGSASTARRGES